MKMSSKPWKNSWLVKISKSISKNEIKKNFALWTKQNWKRKKNLRFAGVYVGFVRTGAKLCPKRVKKSRPPPEEFSYIAFESHTNQNQGISKGRGTPPPPLNPMSQVPPLRNASVAFASIIMHTIVSNKTLA